MHPAITVLAISLSILAPASIARGESGRSSTDIGVLVNTVETSSDSKEREAAIRTLATMENAAARAVPAIIKAFSAGDSSLRLTAASALIDIHEAPDQVVPAMVASLASQDPDVRSTAAWVLSRFAVTGHSEIIALVATLAEAGEGYTARTYAIETLAKVPSEALPALLPILADSGGDPRRRRGAAETIAQMQSLPNSTIPLLIGLLADPGIREPAVIALGNAGAAAATAVDPLLQVADDPAVQGRVAEALGKIGKGAGKAIPKLITLMQLGKYGVSDTAATALGNISSGDAVSVHGLLTVCTDNRSSFSEQAAAHALLKILERSPAVLPLVIPLVQKSTCSTVIQEGLVQHAKAAVPLLAAALEDPAVAEEGQVSRALMRIGPPSTPAMVALLEKNHAAPRSRMAAVEILCGLQQDPSREVRPALIRVLQASATPAALRSAVALALLKHGNAIVPLLPVIFEAIRIENPYSVPLEARSDIEQIGGPAKVLIPQLVGALDDPDQGEGKRLFAIAVLRLFKADSRNAVPSLARLLKANSDITASAAAEALEDIGPDAASAIPELLGALHSSSRASDAAARTLKALGKASVPGLIEIVATHDDDRRLAAVGILRDLGPLAKQAIPALIRLTEERFDFDGVSQHTSQMLLLAELGADAEDALPALADTLSYELPGSPTDYSYPMDMAAFHLAAVQAIMMITQDLQRKEVTKGIPLVRTALESLKTFDAKLHSTRLPKGEDTEYTTYLDRDLLVILKEALDRVQVALNSLEAFRYHQESIAAVSTGAFAVDEELARQFQNSPILNVNGSELTVQQKGKDEVTFLGPQPTNGLNVIKTARDTFLVWREERRLSDFNDPYKKSYAVLVAIGDYERKRDPKHRGKTAFGPVPEMVTNAKALEAALLKLGFPRANIISLYDEHADSHAIENVLLSFWKGGERSSADRLFFYFGGHGTSESSTGLLVTYDYDASRPTLTSLLMSDLTNRHSKNIQARHFMITLDACSAGLAVTGLGDPARDKAERTLLRTLSIIQNDTEPKARNVLVAGVDDQEAVYDNGGIFTQALVRGLLGPADLNGDGIIQFVELGVFVKDDVAYAAHQRGVKQSVGYYKLTADGATGEILFLRKGSP